MSKLSKRARNIAKTIPQGQDTTWAVKDAIESLKKVSAVKFDETLEIALRLGVDPRHADQQVRGTVQMPHGTGKDVRVAVFAQGDDAKAAQKAGADLVGADDLAARVQEGDMPFDRCIATPDMMVLVGKLGRVLGPRGLMPNPKLGTVTKDVAEAVRAAKAGSVNFRTDKAGVIHGGLGKLSASADALSDNVGAFMQAIIKAKPSGAKGNYILSASLSSTMGPGMALDLAGLHASGSPK
ncbi:MAG: 50S ribosomal protein L1 [Pseudomonadota bacterium]